MTKLSILIVIAVVLINQYKPISAHFFGSYTDQTDEPWTWQGRLPLKRKTRVLGENLKVSFD